jgi:hypothetical protein
MFCYGFLFVFACPAPPPVNSFCLLYDPVYLSHADTRKTKEKTDRNNTKYEAICKKG